MSTLQRFWARLAAAGTAATIAVLVPAYAWAASSPALASATDLARRAPRVRTGGFFGLLCCLVVVAVIVLLIVWIIRRGSRRR